MLKLLVMFGSRFGCLAVCFGLTNVVVLFRLCVGFLSVVCGGVVLLYLLACTLMLLVYFTLRLFCICCLNMFTFV